MAFLRLIKQPDRKYYIEFNFDHNSLSVSSYSATKSNFDNCIKYYRKYYREHKRATSAEEIGKIKLEHSGVLSQTQIRILEAIVEKHNSLLEF